MVNFLPSNLANSRPPGRSTLLATTSCGLSTNSGSKSSISRLIAVHPASLADSDRLAERARAILSAAGAVLAFVGTVRGYFKDIYAKTGQREKYDHLKQRLALLQVVDG